MKKLLLFCSIILISNSVVNAQLSAGDLAIIGINSDNFSASVRDDFTFITLRAISAGELVYFTADGWGDNNDWACSNGGGHYSWTAPAGGVSCGTIIHVYMTATLNVLAASTGTITGPYSGLCPSNYLQFNNGDQILMYQASSPGDMNPTFITGITYSSDNTNYNTTTSWNNADFNSANYSVLPPGLTNGVNCVSLYPNPLTINSGLDNSKYTGTLTGSSATLRALINDYTNWSGNDLTPYDISPSQFSASVTCPPPCTAPNVPTVTYSPATVCNGNNATLNISGSLNDATAWQVYTGSCGGTNIGSTAGSALVVTPSFPSTTYYVRGEGGCVTPGSCGQVTVTVTALDDASFSYGLSSYCVNASDPTPTITGLGGGTFTSSPAGLSISASTGQVDVSASTPNTYTVTYTTAGTCPNSSNVNVTINALDDASFSYGSASYCVNASDPTPTITGLTGGTFSSTAGLSINTSTGQIDVSASTPNTYTVTYTTAGSCPNSSNVAVTINALDDASFSYSASAYNSTSGNQTPTITGVGGGTFGSSAGLTINATTGEINPLTSIPGTYTVTYTTNGTCSNSSNVQVTILADLVITEIMYNPPESGTDSLEFIEIYNSGTTAVDVTNYTCTGGNYTFPNTSIASGAFYVITVDTIAFNNVYGMPANGQFTSGLSNAGEDIVLKNSNGIIIDSVNYDDGGVWPSGFSAGDPDGGGASIILCNDTADNNLGSNWSTSTNNIGVTINGFDVLASPFALETCCVTTFGTDSLSACDSLTWLDGNTYYADNFTATYTTTNAAGCDSIVTLDLAVNYSNSGIDIRTVCDSLVWIDSNTYYADNNTATFIVINSTGCDSLVTLDLVVNTSPIVSISKFNPDTICITDPAVSLPGGSPSGGVYSGNGVGGGVFTPSVAGIGTHVVYYSYTDTNSCTVYDSTLITVETCVGVDDFDGFDNVSLLPNPTSNNTVINLNKSYDNVIIELYNTLGQVILKNEYRNVSKINLEIPEEAGTYYIKLKGNNKTLKTLKVLKVN